MDGIIYFFSVIVALIMGYRNGLNTRRKKIVNENNELKKEVKMLKGEIKKIKSIKYDFQVERGLFKKKGSFEFKKDMELIIKIERDCLNLFISLLGLLNYDAIILENKIDISEYETYLRKLEQEKEFIEIDILDNKIIVDVWDIDLNLRKLFNQYINLKEYDLTNRELKGIIKEKFEEMYLKDKKFCRAFARDNRIKWLPKEVNDKTWFEKNK